MYVDVQHPSPLSSKKKEKKLSFPPQHTPYKASKPTKKKCWLGVPRKHDLHHYTHESLMILPRFLLLLNTFHSWYIAAYTNKKQTFSKASAQEMIRKRDYRYERKQMNTTEAKQSCQNKESKSKHKMNIFLKRCVRLSMWIHL